MTVDPKIKRFALSLGGILVLGFLVRIATGNGDFKVMLEAAKLVATHKSPYHVWIFVSEGNYDFYFYSPLWAMMLIPFSHLPNFIPNLLWLLANTWFLYRVWILLAEFTDPSVLTQKGKRWVLALCILMSVRYILYNFEMIQMTIFLLWGALESLRFFRHNRYLAGGALLALIINIKILPLVLIPWLIYRKEFKGAACTMCFSLMYLLIPALFIGWQANLHLHSEWWKMINPMNPEHLSESDPGLHSLTALIPSLLTKSQGGLPYPRNLFNLEAATAASVLQGIRVLLILLTLAFLKWPPFIRARSGLHELRELSYLFLLIPLIFPHQQKYAFFLALPAIFYLSYFIIRTLTAREAEGKTGPPALVMALFFLSFALMTLSTDSVIGRSLNLVTQHYKTITYGALLLLVLLAACSPEHFEKQVIADNDTKMIKS